MAWQDLEPTTPQDYILKGVVNAALGQEQNSPEHLKIAQQYFQVVGGSASECGPLLKHASTHHGYSPLIHKPLYASLHTGIDARSSL